MKRQRSLQPHPRSSAADADHSLAVRGTDLQKAMEHVAAIAGDNPVHAFETAMHAVTSQLAQGAASGGAPAYAPGPMHGPVSRTAAPARRQQHGLLRRCRHRAHGIGLGLERDRPPGHFRQSRRDGRVVAYSRQANRAAGGPSHRRQRGRTAFAPCPACRPQHAVQRAPPVIGQRASRTTTPDLGPAQAPSETFMRLVSVYRAMAAALCCGLGRATRSILSAPAIPATARGAVPAARQARSGQQLGKIDALLLTSDIVMRASPATWRASDLSPGQFDPASPPGRRQLAGGGIAGLARRHPRDAHGFCLAAPLSTRCPGGRRADGRAGRRGRSHAGMIRQPAR